MPSLLKGKADQELRFASSPHLKNSLSTQVILWGLLASLFPILIGSIIFFGWDALRTISVVLAAGAAIWFLYGKTRLNEPLSNSIFLVALLAFILPSKISFWAAGLGSLVTLLLGYQFFGGLGQNIFHPTLVGYLTLAGLFPNEMMSEPTFASKNMLAIAISAGIAIGVRWIRWEVVFLYLISNALVSYALGTFSNFFSANILFCAVFILTNTVTSPISKLGRVIFAITAGILTAVLKLWCYDLVAFASSMLIMNGLTPLIDRILKPERS